jgi:hypothetical protein
VSLEYTPIRKLTALTVWLILVASVFAGPTLELPKEVTGNPGDFVMVAAKTDGKQVRWIALDPGLAVFPAQLLKDSKTGVVSAKDPGRYRLLAYTAGGDEPSDPVITTVVIGNAPVPPSPIPPGPNPPTPPIPTPGVGLIEGKGLQVLVLIETSDAPKYPPAQYNAIYGQEFHDYLDSKTPLGPIPGQHEWWILDKDSDVSALPAKWKNAVKRAKESKDFKTPWIIVSNPDKGGGWEGPLPVTKQEILDLVKKYGG